MDNHNQTFQCLSLYCSIPLLHPLTIRNYSIKVRICPFHNEKNTNFCEICEQVGCESCLVYGPHNNQMHRVSKLDECFKARYLYLNEVVCGELLTKRDKLNQKLE